ncbi:hypothetical protein [Faecalicatena fissicatena]|nr:hypothetical protein [Faecalicatena fissicatena]
MGRNTGQAKCENLRISLHKSRSYLVILVMTAAVIAAGLLV